MESAKPGPEYPKAAFAEPLPYGYLYAGLTIDPPGRAPFLRRSVRREEALGECKAVAGRLEALGEVVRATVYRTVLIPPVGGAPRFDAVVLVETTSPETVAGVRSSEAFGRLGADFVMAARNARRIGDTHKTLSGTFLFNHFAAEDPPRPGPVHARPAPEAELPHVRASEPARERDGRDAPAVRARLRSSGADGAAPARLGIPGPNFLEPPQAEVRGIVLPRTRV